jgi:hypothetical protein
LTAWKAIAEGDKGALVALALMLIGSAYVLGYTTGFRSAKRSHPESADESTSNAGDPAS